MSERDVRALKIVLVIIVSVAVVFCVSSFVTHQQQQHDRQVELLDQP